MVFLRWASASGPKARSRSFGREASKTREHYSYVPGHFFLSDYICLFFYLCHRKRNAYNLRTRYRRELWFTAFCRPKPCGGKVFFRFLKMRARAGRRPKNCFYITLSKSRTVWRKKFNFAAFCSPTKSSSNRLLRFDLLRECAGRRPFIRFSLPKLERL